MGRFFERPSRIPARRPQLLDCGPMIHDMDVGDEVVRAFVDAATHVYAIEAGSFPDKGW